MVASGLPRRNGNKHASEIASMALAVREGVKSFKVRHLPERKVQIRIGINSGNGGKLVFAPIYHDISFLYNYY